MFSPSYLRIGLGSIVLASASICSSCTAQQHHKPNVLWIVWDTVRADHLGSYGYEQDTTPFLDQWAKDARVFENCLSTAGYTLPSHASMFTGLLPSEHCAHNGTRRLADDYVTIAELLRDAGYQTYAFSANPHVSAQGNLVQGFDTVLHPWSNELREEAVGILRRKLEGDRSSEFAEHLRAYERGERELTIWHLKAAGQLAERATRSWLGTIDRNRPFFVFINYMEAHRPYIPPRSYRERRMTAEEVERSYGVDRSWTTTWEYTFGLRDYDEEELALTRATYDATLSELDDYLKSLLEKLEADGYLDDTIVILTSDHGEHLGEQHMLDHQYSLYQPLLRVPLVVHYPARFAAGRDSRPVVNYDLFPTLLELTGVEPSRGSSTHALSLLRPQDDRVRFAEEPKSSELGVRMIKEGHPEFDPAPWLRQLRSLVVGERKLIWATGGSRELFDLAADPLETHDLAGQQPEVALSMNGALEQYYAALAHCLPQEPVETPLTPEQRDILKGLGYVK